MSNFVTTCDNSCTITRTWRRQEEEAKLIINIHNLTQATNQPTIHHPVFLPRWTRLLVTLHKPSSRKKNCKAVRIRNCKIATFLFVQIVHAAGCWGRKAAVRVLSRANTRNDSCSLRPSERGRQVAAAAFSSQLSNSVFFNLWFGRDWHADNYPNQVFPYYKNR